MSAAEFFRTARVRHRIWEMRQEGLPPPWTADVAFSRYKFTNVFRELDRTTVWMREHVREPMDELPMVLLGIVVFRWFNRIESGEIIFDGCSPPGGSNFCRWAHGEHVDWRSELVGRIGARGPFVTGAYIIKTRDGMNKLDGVIDACQNFRDHSGWRETARLMERERWSLLQAHTWLRQVPYQGAFTAYEAVSDMRHTHLLRHADDIMTWANPGPGAKRGLNRVHGRPTEQTVPARQMLDEMRELLTMSQSPVHWPARWPSWEMREVEHWLCEFDKHERVVRGEGRPRSTYP